MRKIGRLHLYDCLRANKSLAAWGVEGRVPFLDKEFLDVAMRLNPEAKMAGKGRIEKWVLRKAFEDLLPEEIVWRQKEQFSDGVGYGWIDTLKRSPPRRFRTARWSTPPSASLSTRRRTRRSTTTARSSRSTSPRRPPRRACLRALGGVQHGRSAGLGPVLRQLQRPLGTCRTGRAQHRSLPRNLTLRRQRTASQPAKSGSCSLRISFFMRFTPFGLAVRAKISIFGG